MAWVVDTCLLIDVAEATQPSASRPQSFSMPNTRKVSSFAP